MESLSGKTVINVGGAGGIGFEFSKALLAAGVAVSAFVVAIRVHFRMIFVRRK